jgi:hypothetical protein
MPPGREELFVGIRGGARPSPMIWITLADGPRQIYAFDGRGLKEYPRKSDCIAKRRLWKVWFVVIRRLA